MFKEINWKYILWPLAAILLIHTASQIPFAELVGTLKEIKYWQIGFLILLNTVIVFLMGTRWWLFLRAFGFKIPYLKIIQYRLVSFSISYITPGPHLGGEPLQLHLLNTRHSVPNAVNLAALSLDKLMDLLANFTIMLFGIILTTSSGILGSASNPLASLYAGGLLIVPVLYYFLLFQNRRPISELAALLPNSRSILKWTLPAERKMQTLLNTDIRTFLLAGTASAFIWLALVFEYWLTVHYLGHTFTFTQIIAVITAARVAMLTPLPGALGALELGQAWMMAMLGFPPTLGIALSLLVRSRDIFFSLIGAIWHYLATPHQTSYP